MTLNMNNTRQKGLLLLSLAFLGAGGAAIGVVRAQENQKKQPPTPGSMLEKGFLDLDTPSFSLRLVRSSQTVAALKPKGAGDFDFTPGDLLVERSKDGFYHLGDI